MAETDVNVTQVEETTPSTNGTVTQDVPQEPENKTVEELTQEVEKLRAESAKRDSKLTATIDKLTKENADYKRQLRASKSAEDQRAEEEKERQEAIQQELEALRKQAAVSTISKSVMAFVGDEATANTIAEALYGAADVDAALDAFNKAWTAREKQLKLQYGKIPAPEAGDGGPQISATDLSNMTYRERLEFKQKYPDTYKKLTV